MPFYLLINPKISTFEPLFDIVFKIILYSHFTWVKYIQKLNYVPIERLKKHLTVPEQTPSSLLPNKKMAGPLNIDIFRPYLIHTT
jgi:hypothetical protein